MPTFFELIANSRSKSRGTAGVPAYWAIHSVRVSTHPIRLVSRQAIRALQYCYRAAHGRQSRRRRRAQYTRESTQRGCLQSGNTFTRLRRRKLVSQDQAPQTLRFVVIAARFCLIGLLGSLRSRTQRLEQLLSPVPRQVSTEITSISPWIAHIQIVRSPFEEFLQCFTIIAVKSTEGSCSNRLEVKRAKVLGMSTVPRLQ